MRPRVLRSTKIPPLLRLPTAASRCPNGNLHRHVPQAREKSDPDGPAPGCLFAHEVGVVKYSLRPTNFNLNDTKISGMRHLNDPERQFISTIGGGLNFDRDEGTELREVPRRGDGMCLFYSLLKKRMTLPSLMVCVRRSMTS